MQLPLSSLMVTWSRSMPCKSAWMGPCQSAVHKCGQQHTGNHIPVVDVCLLTKFESRLVYWVLLWQGSCSEFICVVVVTECLITERWLIRDRFVMLDYKLFLACDRLPFPEVADILQKYQVNLLCSWIIEIGHFTLITELHYIIQNVKRFSLPPPLNFNDATCFIFS